jgi:hypothetical protein
MKSGRYVEYYLSEFLHRHITLLLGALLLSTQMMPAALAAPLTIPALPTTLVSDADRMISYRHQNHMWQTSDGATHVVVNSGTLAGSNGSLTLYSSFDAGNSWVAMLSLANTDMYSTSDGVLSNGNLTLAYSSTQGQILFSVAHYNSAQQTWSLVRTETVFGSSDLAGINPAIAIDNLGTIWCAFVSKDMAPTNRGYNIKLIQRPSGGTSWQDTGLIFGPTDNLSIERSARPVVLSNGVGMVYSVHQNIFWAYRANGLPTNQPWVEQTLFTSTPPYDIDPYESHFSIVADNQKNLHLATTDHGRLLYFRFVNYSQMWNPVKILTGDINAGYVQATWALGTLAVFYNNNATVRVIQSADKGTTFTPTNILSHQPAPTGSTLDYSHPRIETPGGLSPLGGPIPVFQQYADGATQKVMYFAVPVMPSN